MPRHFRDYTETYDKKDIRVMPGRSRGGGAASTFARFRKAVRHAVEAGIIDKDPCKGIRFPSGEDSLVKAILGPEETARLLATHYPGENEEIRRAFIFSLYTGVRFCDIKALEYRNIDYHNMFISFRQAKTRDRSSRSMVYIPLRADLMKTIGERGRPDQTIFRLPSHTSCLKHLRKWTRAAGIEKHITWHCARHSFATNILRGGAGVRVIAELLGHSSLKYVEKYTRVADSVKREAVDSLPPIV